MSITVQQEWIENLEGCHAIKNAEHSTKKKDKQLARYQ